MCGPYWSQWSKTELDSMHGIEPEDYEEDHDEEELDMIDEEEECSYCCARSPCGNCMDCLGMSWSDFM